MSKRKDVGYKRPPKEHQFKPGNQAARKNKGKRRKKTMTMAEAIEKALNTKRKIRKGDQELTLPLAEIVSERLVQMAMKGSTRDLAKLIEIFEKYGTEVTETEEDNLEVTFVKAEGSAVPRPSHAKGEEQL